MSTVTKIDELFRNTGGLNGLFRELQRPNLANIAYVHALRSSQQQGTSIYDSAAYADSQDSAFWWKIRRDAEFASYIENRRKSVAGLKSLVVPGTKAPTKADILIARAQDYLWDLQPGARRSRYGLTEGIFRGSSWAAMTAVRRTLQLPGDDRPRVWFVPGKFQHVDRWRFRIQRRTDRGNGVNPTGNFWEFFSWKADDWVPLENPEHFLTFFYDRTESDHGYGYGLNNSLYVWLKGKEIALNNGLRGLRRWASGIMRVKIDELRNASADKDNLQHALDWLEVVRTLYTEDVLVYGKNDDVDAIWPSGQGHQIVMSMIEYFDASAKRLIQSADPEGGQGSFAKAAVQADEKADYFAFDRDNLSEDYSDQGLGLFYELNKANYSALCAANGEPLGVSGRYQIGAREDMDPQAAAEYIGKLQEAGFEIPKQWAHDLANVPIAQEDEDILEPPEPPAGADPFGGEFNGEAQAAGAGGSLGANGDKMPTKDNRLQFAAAIPDEIPNLEMPGFDTGASYGAMQAKAAPRQRMQTYADGRWVTIGQGDEGGTPVFIEGGEITKGPAAVEDKKIADVDQDKPEPKKKKARKKKRNEQGAPPGGFTEDDRVDDPAGDKAARDSVNKDAQARDKKAKAREKERGITNAPKPFEGVDLPSADDIPAQADFVEKHLAESGPDDFINKVKGGWIVGFPWDKKSGVEEKTKAEAVARVEKTPAALRVSEEVRQENAPAGGEKIEHTAESAAKHLSPDDYAAKFNKRELKQMQEAAQTWTNGWLAVQAVMRGEKKTPGKHGRKLTKDDRRDTKSLQKLLDGGPHVSGTIQRGLALRPGEETDAFVSMLKGGTLDHDVPSSWTSDGAQAASFAGLETDPELTSVVMTANTDRGVSLPGLQGERFSEEQEVMLGAGGLKVTNWSERVVNGKRVIEVSIDARG